MDKELKKVIDKILLVLSAFAVGLCLLLYFYLFDKLKIKEEWIHFISMSILYIVVFIYGVKKYIGFKNKVATTVNILLMIFFIVFPILVGYFIFYFKIFPFPKKGSFYVWMIILTALASTTITCLNQTLKILERRKRSKTEH